MTSSLPPDGWRRAKLGHCVSLATGFPFRSAEYTSDAQDPRLLRGDNIGQGHLRWDGAKRWSRHKATEVAEYALQPGDVVLAMDRPWIDAGLKFAVVTPQDVPSLLVQRVARLRAGGGLDQGFLRYLVASPSFTCHILAVQTGTAVPHISGDQIREFAFLWPPLPEQKAIAHILGSLDDKIELNRRMNETLEAMARAIFKSWFVDFDPVRAKMEGRQLAGIDAATAALFPDEFQDSELGEIPKGWEVRCLGELLSLDKGVSYKGKYLSETGVPMVNLGCFLGGGRFSSDRLKPYSGDFRPNHVVLSGDIVMANTDMTQRREVLGSPAEVPRRGDAQRLIFSHHVYALRFHVDGPERYRRYVLFALMEPSFRERAAGFATGTTVLALPRDAVLDYPVTFPPTCLLDRFNALTMPMRVLQECAASESYTLAAIRDALLPKLISGSLRVQAPRGGEPTDG